MYQTTQETKKLDKYALELTLLLIRRRQMVEEKYTNDKGTCDKAKSRIGYQITVQNPIRA